MDSQPVEAEQLLDSLDRVAGQSAEAAKRRNPRRAWRKRLRISVTHLGGNQRSVEVVTRNLSGDGLSFLNNGFLHTGTRCALQLITTDNAWIDVQSTVVRCRLVSGRVHEVGLRFDESVDESQLVSEKLCGGILLVDDAEDILGLTGHFLKKAGAEVITVNRGARALKLIAEQHFDLILMDVEMPGITGPQVAKNLRERGITIPIIAYTASDDKATHEECLAAGCTDVLVKPVQWPDLIDAVARYLAVEEPIISKHAGNPEMAEFIHDFVTGLPARIQKMLQCVQARTAEVLAPLARQLKVAASDEGGCGFGELSALADALAKALTGNVDWRSAEEAVHTLSDLSRRVKETDE